LPRLLISDFRRLISDNSNLNIPLPPWQCVWGERGREYYLEEKQRALNCLAALRVQERAQAVSTTVVLQLVLSGWSLRNGLQLLRDREVQTLLKTFEETAVNYGYGELWHTKLYTQLLERLSSILHLS
jgi:hypothetical protein